MRHGNLWQAIIDAYRPRFANGKEIIKPRWSWFDSRSCFRG